MEGPRDLVAVRLTSQQRLGTLRGLLDRDLAGQRRLERVDDRLENGRAGCGEEILDDAPAGLGPIHREAGAAACAREGGEVDGLEPCARS